MKRDVNDTERMTLAAVKALRISMCEFSDQRNAAFMSAQMKQIWIICTVQMISQTFSAVCFDCDDEPMRGDGCPCYWFRLCVVRFCVSLRFGLIVSVSVKYLLASAALRHKITAFKSSTDALVTIMTVVSVFVCG